MSQPSDTVHKPSFSGHSPGVLNLCFSRGWGGLEMANLQWAKRFHRQGYRSYSICYENSPLHQKTLSEGLPVETRTPHEYFSPRTARYIRQFVIENKIDMILLQRLRDLWIVSPALIGLNTTLVGFAQMWLDSVNKKDFLHRWLYGRMDLLITLTPSQGTAFLKCVPYPAEKTINIPNSVDSQKFNPSLRNSQFRKDFGIGEDEVIIGCVGRLDPFKGQKELIEAFANVHTEGKRLILVGDSTVHNGNEYLNELHQTVKDLKLEGRVIFTGFREDIPNILANFDIFVLNSYKEAFGFVVIEAMASGTSVIATQSGGVPDILENGTYGWLVPPQGTFELANTLNYLITHPEERLQKAKLAREHVIKNYEESAIFHRLIRETQTRGLL